MVNLAPAKYRIINSTDLALFLQHPADIPAIAWKPLPQDLPSYLISEITIKNQHYFALLGQATVAVAHSQRGNILPVFCYPRQPIVEMIIDDWVGHFAPVFEFATATGVNHRLWQIADPDELATITSTFQHIQPITNFTTTDQPQLTAWIADSELTTVTADFQLPVIADLVVTSQTES